MKQNLFQYIILGVMGLFILAGVAAFALYKGSGKNSYELLVWGEIPEQQFNLMKGYLSSEGDSFSIVYQYVEPERMTRDLTDALSTKTGPDIILTTADKLLENSERLLPVSFEMMPVSMFESTYLPQLLPLYQGSNGFRGLPLMIDPLVLYSNSTLLARNGIANPPSTWQEMGDYIGRVTQLNESGDIIQSAMALGTMSNVTRSKDIISSLLLQSGNPITQITGETSQTFLQVGPTPNSDARYIVNHYVQYSDPQKSLYTWNSTMPRDEDEFIAGRLASYIGYGSEAQMLADRNPNMSVVVSRFPQALTSGNQAVYGKVYGFSITREGESRYEGALKAVLALTKPENAQEFATMQHMAPATRSAFGTVSNNPEQDFKGRDVIYNSALISSGWLDPDPEESNKIFSQMVSTVVTGAQSVSDAVQEADRDLKDLLE